MVGGIQKGDGNTITYGDDMDSTSVSWNVTMGSPPSSSKVCSVGQSWPITGSNNNQIEVNFLIGSQLKSGVSIGH